MVKEFLDGSYLEYGRGNFDNWCVYYVNSEGDRKPPLDVDYFQQLRELADNYGERKVYDDFVEIYNHTGRTIDNNVLNQITRCASTYDNIDILDVDKLFTTLYMTMVSEENYPGTRLGRRIKRLGIYELLFSERNVQDSANFMRGMSWRDIDFLCKERGF